MGTVCCAEQNKPIPIEQSDDHKTLIRSASRVGAWSLAVSKDPSQHLLYSEYQRLLQEAGATYEILTTTFSEGDALIIVDMQNDFVPENDAPDGGKFGVAEGAGAAAEIVKLIRKAAANKALIVATRDYHPIDHCSFNTHGGPFPPHCVQGSKGALFFDPIEKALVSARSEQGGDVRVVFKGFAAPVDSFGGVTYPEQYFNDRHLGKDPNEVCHGCSAVQWTGSFNLKCSNIAEDINAPPDVLAVFDRETLADVLQKASINRLFVVGLALDFCVLDTALNAAAAKVASGGVYMVVDAARAAHIPGVGGFGTGFLSDPKEIVKKIKGIGVKLIRSPQLGI